MRSQCVRIFGHYGDRLIEEGVVANHAEIAKMMGLSRARVTQIADLLYLAPEIQEHILAGEIDGAIPERAVRSITRITIWKKQCKACKTLLAHDTQHQSAP